jgi:hydroxymethylpyrimidine/phosphomethylpyrimidine kinase
MPTLRVIVTIAGSDSSAGAGIQADLKAIAACGGYGASVLTAITAQNSRGVHELYELRAALVESQIDAVFGDLEVAALKSGMLASSRIVEVVERALRRYRPEHYVLDPVLVSKSGHALLREDALESVRRKLVPLATVVTPNRYEARVLSGIDASGPEEAGRAGERLLDLGCGAVLVKGGHMETGGATDVLVTAEGVEIFEAPRLDTPHTHGTGCTYSAAIAAYLGRGLPLAEAVRAAKRYVTEAIRGGLALGGGRGPTDHFFYLRRPDVLEWIEQLHVREPPPGTPATGQASSGGRTAAGPAPARRPSGGAAPGAAGGERR